MLSRRAVRAGLQSSLNIRVYQGEGATFTNHFPDEEDLRSFMLDLRKLLADKSEVQFSRVMHSARVAFNAGADDLSLTTLPKAWNHALKRSPYKFSAYGRVWTPELLLDTWFNAELFHTDRDKAEAWARLSESPFAKLVLVHTASTLTTLTMYGMARIDFLLGGPGHVSIANGRARAQETNEPDSISCAVSD